MKKYKSVVSQLSVDQITLSEQTQQIAELEHEKQVKTITFLSGVLIYDEWS